MKQRQGQHNRLRIIGGEWRRRVLDFAPVPGLRPTPDRVRETLFNWLQPTLPGARCLDLFAGSGALGWEAASRGAGRVVLVDRDRRVTRHLARVREQLGASRVEIIEAPAEGFLRGEPQGFDVVFADPPFDSELLASVLPLLRAPGWLVPQARVYAEFDARRSLPALDPAWSVLREGRAGHVGYALLALP